MRRSSELVCVMHQSERQLWGNAVWTSISMKLDLMLKQVSRVCKLIFIQKPTEQMWSQNNSEHQTVAAFVNFSDPSKLNEKTDESSKFVKIKITHLSYQQCESDSSETENLVFLTDSRSKKDCWHWCTFSLKSEQKQSVCFLWESPSVWVEVRKISINVSCDVKHI